MRAREGLGQAHTDVRLAFLKEFCMARLHFLDLPRPVTEATEFRATTERREEAPRLAARIRRKEQTKVLKYKYCSFQSL